MARILGLDLGTNSIGWAVVDLSKQKIVDTGVRIFPEGINRETLGKEVSKNVVRREARQIRRQHFRTRMRKKFLIELLRKNRLYPKNEDEIAQWTALDPYFLRTKALDEKLTPKELGR